MYAQVCNGPDLAYAVCILGRFQSNLEIIHRKATKKIICYLQRTKCSILTFQGSDNLHLVGYSDSDLLVVLMA